MKTTSKFLALTMLAMACGELSAQNSTRKIRSKPSASAMKAGEAVPWRASLGAALEEARELGRPVFWYVPTLAGSPMDRKDNVDWSVMAGPFCWPRAVAVLRDHYVPVKEAAGRQLAERYGLRPPDFVEPGFLILAPDGEELDRVHEWSSLHPRWFLHRLKAGGSLGAEAVNPGFLESELAQRCLDGEAVLEGATLDGATLEEGDRAEARWLLGAGRWSRGDEAGAHEQWAKLAAEHPDSPLAAKAQMEIEGFGPFVRGLEWPVPVSDAALEDSGDGTRRPGVYTEPQLWERGARFLMHMQRGHGGFTDSIYDFGGTDSLPNVYSAISAIATLALLEATQHGVELPGLEESLEKALGFSCDDARLAMEDTDERLWVYLYRIRLLTRWLDRRPQDEARIRPLLEKAAADVVGMQQEGGAWYHEYPSPFITAQALVALHDAKEHGVRIEGIGEVVEKGVAALMKCRTAEGAYTYYYRPNRSARARVEEGVGRMPLGEEALLRWKVGRRGDVARALELSFEHQEHLFAVQKYDDHASPLGYGGFFFWWDLQVRGEALNLLPEGATRSRLQAEQRKVLLSLPEFDGAFLDSHEVGRVYGTAMALWCLALLEG